MTKLQSLLVIRQATAEMARMGRAAESLIATSKGRPAPVRFVMLAKAAQIARRALDLSREVEAARAAL